MERAGEFQEKRGSISGGDDDVSLSSWEEGFRLEDGFDDCCCSDGSSDKRSSFSTGRKCRHRFCRMSEISGIYGHALINQKVDGIQIISWADSGASSWAGVVSSQ